MLIFHYFTWQQFLIAALVLTVAWYVAVGLLYFRRKPNRIEPEKQATDEPEISLMGAARPVDGLSSLSTDDFAFNRLGIVPDILEELKSIFHILDRDNGGKAEFLSLFGLVNGKYPQIKGSPDQDALNDYIRENLPFEITEEELEGLWH